MRCDLHVHSWHSGAVDLPVLRHLGRECYSEPEAVYEAARRRGMDLVTLTDHDSVSGALRLLSLPDTFVSEEVTLVLPGERQLHLGVYDITERQHETIQRRRRDPEALFAFLAEERIPACVNHLFSALTGARELDDVRLPLGRLPLIEALNGSQPEGHNEYARVTGRLAGMAPVGGSDSHTLSGVARAYTTVPGALTKEDFLAGLRRGMTVPCGRSGSYARLTAEVARLFAAGYRDAASGFWRQPARTLALLGLLPFLPLMPFFTAGLLLHEKLFGTRLHGALRAASGWPAETPVRPRPLLAARTLGEAA
jgi:predicted metal-dependent phosphoesterase TrpH